MFDLLFCASFYNHLKILPLISCTTIVLKHALLESKHDTASKHKTHRSQIASGELLSRAQNQHILKVTTAIATAQKVKTYSLIILHAVLFP